MRLTDHIKSKLRAWLGIETDVAVLAKSISLQTDDLHERINELDALATLDADEGVRGPCTIILSGVYRGRGYVRFYEVGHDEFRQHVERFRDQRKSGFLRNIDRIPHYGGSFDFLSE